MSDSATPRSRTALLLVAGALVAIHAVFVARFWWVTDDALISFRYSRNFAQGEGLRFNLWDQVPVEGYSNFLWVVLGGAVHALGLELVRWMPLLSAVLGAVLLVLLLHRLVRVLEVPLPIAGVAVGGLACYPAFAVWSTSGLATVPLALLLFLTFDRLVLTGGRPDGLGAGVFGALLALIRVEGVAWFAVVLALALGGQLLRKRLDVRPLITAACLVVVVLGAHLAWRYSYYGELLPNTYYAKRVSGTTFLDRGFRYVMANVLTFVTPFVLLPGTILALRRERRAVGLGVAALAWAFPLYAVLVAGDYMPMGRFLVPGLPFLTILVAWTLADLAGRGPARARLGVAAGVVLALVGALPGWGVHVVPAELRAWCRYRGPKADVAPEYERWVDLSSKVRGWKRRGRMLRAFAEAELEPPVSMAIRALGAIGYYTDFLMYDCAGLTVPEIAHREVTVWADQPGHDKAVELYDFADRCPTLLRIWTFAADEPEEIATATKQALRRAAGRDLEGAYRPRLVKMVSEDEGRTTYLLGLIQDDAATQATWRQVQQITAVDVESAREINY